MFTKTFQNLSKSDTAIAGGKGASLGEMTQAGISVPPGFVVLSDGFEKFLEETDLNVEIDSILHSVNIKEMHTVENASEKIKDLILKAKMPKDISEEIKKEFKKLKSKFVAVRSSATAEDSSSAAWAGQLDSFLNTTEKTLLENIQRCWASLFTPRAIFYRFEKGLHNSKISVAVVVQKMVESEVSGIAFSVHPVTQDHNQLIIEAGYGLGEAIVSGQITPDSYVVEKEPRRIIDKNISAQERGIYRKSEGGGNEWQDISKEKGEQQKLTDEQILELSELIIKIEDHYGAPQDIEWARENGKFYIVQSRPITTLEKDSFNKEDVNLDKVREFQKIAKNREYIQQQGNMSIALLGNICNVINKKYLSKYGYVKVFPIMVLQKKNQSICHFDLEMYRDFSRVSYERIKSTVSNLPEYLEYEKVVKKINKEYQSFEIKKSKNELKKQASLYFDLAKEVLISTLFTEAIDHELAKELAEREGVAEIENFIEVATLATKPSFIVHQNELWLDGKDISWSFTNYFAAPTKEKRKLLAEEKNTDKSKKEVQEEISKTKKNILKNRDKVEAFIKILPDNQKRLVEFIQLAINIRDERKEFILKLFTILSDTLRELAYQYGISYEAISTIADYELDRLDDENFLEILKERSIKGVVLISHHDGSEIFNVNYEDAKKIILDNNFEGQNEIVGVSANNGKYVGRVKVILSEDEFNNFLDGNVLVTGMTRAEYVPLMKKAGAIITNEGGVTCHAAIISRELNKPCIIGIKIATQVLHDGDLVEVDADKGVVRIMEKAEEKKNDGQSGPITTLGKK